MAHRSIGQERLGFASEPRSASSLDELARLLDRDEIAALLGGIHSNAKGEAAWPPLAMFKALLLSVWYDLSDVKLAEAPRTKRADKLPIATISAVVSSNHLG